STSIASSLAFCMCRACLNEQGEKKTPGSGFTRPRAHGVIVPSKRCLYEGKGKTVTRLTPDRPDRGSMRSRTERPRGTGNKSTEIDLTCAHSLRMYSNRRRFALHSQQIPANP